MYRHILRIDLVVAGSELRWYIWTTRSYAPELDTKRALMQVVRVGSSRTERLMFPVSLTFDI